MQYLEVKKARIEIIPMIDIMLFLLVFFIMVTIHMIPDKGLPAQMPGSSTAQELPKPKLVINLQVNGDAEVDGKTYSPSALEDYLRQHDPKNLQVTIAADKNADVDALVHVMDSCRKAGVTAIGLASRLENSR
ncbi:MAG: ExbD/TolR family protein [Acidithiobacillus sp.]|uniref:ExbD/TolR family protein n=1 Tax=Acidithiobacillus sp. TaxID=1872118 RepID=UPI003D03AFD0